MSKDATKIFGGPVKTIEIDTDSGFGSANNLGYASAECEITWEPAPVETSVGQMFQPKGIGKIKLVLQQTDQTKLGYLKTARTTEHYVRVTDYNDVARATQVPMFLNYKPINPYNAQDVHTFEVTAQIATEEPDDFVDFQA